MQSVNDYQQQLAKMQRFNRRMMWATAIAVTLLFLGSFVYALALINRQDQKTKQVLTTINDLAERNRAATIRNQNITLYNQQGGDITRCILAILPEDRTEQAINQCYPTGDAQSWMSARDQALDK